MDAKLFTQAITKVLAGILLTGLLLFLPAWSFSYWQGWLLMGILFIPMIVAGFILMFKNPDLLRKRLNAKEEQSEQKTVLLLSGLMFLAACVVAGLGQLCRRCGLSDRICIVCGSAERKYLSLTNGRGAERSGSDRYRTVRGGASPDVYDHAPFIPFHALCIGFGLIFCDHACLHTDHRKKDPE